MFDIIHRAWKHSVKNTAWMYAVYLLADLENVLDYHRLQIVNPLIQSEHARVFLIEKQGYRSKWALNFLKLFIFVPITSCKGYQSCLKVFRAYCVAWIQLDHLNNLQFLKQVGPKASGFKLDIPRELEQPKYMLGGDWTTIFEGQIRFIYSWQQWWCFFSLSRRAGTFRRVALNFQMKV